MAETSNADKQGATWTYQGYHLDKGNFVTAMVHLYRAEVTRTNLWRNRLDTTTNWAVVTTAAALTFTFSSAQNPHFVLLLVLLLVLNFLAIEARRYSYYSLWYHRVRLLETEFFAKMVAPPFQPSAGWGEALNETLTQPMFPIAREEAAARRYLRNYVWLMTLILFSWLLKLMVHPKPAQSARDIVAHAAIGRWIPGAWVIGILGVTYVVLSIGALVIAGQEQRIRATPSCKGLLPTLKIRRQQGEQLTLAIIITDQKQTIGARLMDELARGVTAVDGTGMYTGKRRDVLLCAITRSQIAPLENIVNEVDENAFLILTEASDVRGFGFTTFEPPD